MILKLISHFYSKTAREQGDKRQLFVRNFLGSLSSGEKILDAGAGTQRYRPYSTHLNYLSQDFCLYDGSYGGLNQSANWDVSNIDIVSDITKIPVDDNSFDAIICTDVLEHVPRVYETCIELRRIVRSGGKICITVPTQCDLHQAPFFFSGGYSHFFFKEVFKEDDVRIIFESGYYGTIDQKIYLGFRYFVDYVKDGHNKIFNLILLLFYTLFSLPFVYLLRLFPSILNEIGNNGLFITITKK